MPKSYTICIGSVGGGLSCSPDGGDTWNRIRTPLPSECNVRALHVYPDGSKRVLAGTDGGIFKSEDNGNTWSHLESPMESMQIWSVTTDPEDPDTIFAGTRPNAFRSKDGGRSWEELSMGVNMNCPIGTPRTTNVIVDPRDHRTVWAGVEVDGVYKSLDGGDNWIQLPDLGPDRRWHRAGLGAKLAAHPRAMAGDDHFRRAAKRGLSGDELCRDADRTGVTGGDHRLDHAAARRLRRLGLLG